MLRRRIIPCLDVAGDRVVKGVQFVDLTDAGDPVALASKYAAEGADEICILDITASHEHRPTLLNMVSRTAATVNIPLTVGGGVRSVADMRDVLRAGADKVAVNSAAVERPQLLEECAEAFGRQCVVLSIDAKRSDPSSWSVWTHGGRQSTDLDAVDWARTGSQLGAGEILLTSIDQDGTKSGYDLALLGAVKAAVEVPVVASGGAGTTSDMVAAFRWGNADAVLAASIFHNESTTVAAVKRSLAAAGIEVRTESAVSWP